MSTPDNRSTDERKAAFNRGINAFILGVILAAITPILPEDARFFTGLIATSSLVLGVIPIVDSFSRS
ncbi:MAG: hypothetical protein AAB895_02585 [Patescibacteria group bacterium]